LYSTAGNRLKVIDGYSIRRSLKDGYRPKSDSYEKTSPKVGFGIS